MTDNLGNVLIHSNTTNGSTTFEDSSGEDHTVTAYDVTHSTAYKKFGTSSLNFTANANSRLVITNQGDFNLGTDNFTLDYWEYKVTGSSNNSRYAFEFGDNIDSHISRTDMGTIYTIFRNQYIASPSQDQWNHVALVRSGNTFYVFFNGTVAWSGTKTAAFGDAGNLTIGNNGDTPYFEGAYDGYIDEFRFVAGTAIWTSNFTPPTAAYAASTVEYYTQELDTSSQIAIDATFSDGFPGVSCQETTPAEIAATATGHINYITPLSEPTSYPIIMPDSFLETCINYTDPIELGLVVEIDDDGGGSGGSEFDPTRSFDIYLLSITGYKDGYDEITVPLESFQARLRSGEKSYLSVVIPGLDYAEDIANRPNADIRIVKCQKKDGVIINRVEIANVEMDYINVHEGSVNQTIVLSGHKEETVHPKEVTLTDSNYTATTNGRLRARFPYPDLYLKPGDTINIGDDQIVADVITIYMSATQQSMEVAEA